MHANFVLPSVTRLSPRVWRVLGQNPGPMTLGGTNTYLLGTGSQRCLIDTGDSGVPAYQALLRELLDKEQAVLNHMVLTHWHHDHVGGVADLLRDFPRASVWKKPSIVAEGTIGFTSMNMVELWQKDPTSGRPTLRVDAETTVEVVETPGHTDDHVTLRLVEENALFTGDCILGGSSSVFACYADFMSSLQRLQALEPSRLYPGHGPVVEDASQRIAEQIAHRQKREAQLLACLDRARGSGLTIVQMVEMVYADTPKHLHGAAAVNVLHHMRKLLIDMRVCITQKEGNAAVVAFQSLGDYDGGEGSSLDMERVTMIAQHVQWNLV